MRKKSLAGPVLLIVIGAVFLARNLKPDLLSWEAIAVYWPVLLIAWGVLRLLEVLVAWLQRRPLPPKGISGGEWALVFLICLAGMSLYYTHKYIPRIAPLINIRTGAELFGEPYDFPADELKREATARVVVIENLRGNVRVAGVEGKEIAVRGRKSVRALSRADAESANAQSAIEVVNEPDRIVVRSNQERVPEQVRVSTDLEVSVPRTSEIRIAGRSGDYDVVGVQGVEIKSDSGSVRAQDIGGRVRTDVRKSQLVRLIGVKGEVEVLGAGRDVELENVEGQVMVNGYFSGTLQCRKLSRALTFQSGMTELRIAAVPGWLEMNLGDLKVTGASGPLSLTARTKDVEITDFEGELKVNVDRGDVTVTFRKAIKASAEMITRSGDVEVSLPQGSSFEIEAEAQRGEIENLYGPPLEVTAVGVRGAKLKGAVGKGPRITIRTDRGNVTIRKD